MKKKKPANTFSWHYMTSGLGAGRFKLVALSKEIVSCCLLKPSTFVAKTQARTIVTKSYQKVVWLTKPKLCRYFFVMANS